MAVHPEPESRPLRVLMVTAELERFARTGGLGDAVFGLAGSLARQGHDVVVVTPRYGITSREVPTTALLEPTAVELGDARGPSAPSVGMSVARLESGTDAAFSVVLLECDSLYGRAGIYGDSGGLFVDNALRFALLARVALASADRILGALGCGDGATFDVVHAHDWHAALALVAARRTGSPAVRNARRVLTIHNMAFQGQFDAPTMHALGFDEDAIDTLGFSHQGGCNWLKAAMEQADAVIAVSPSYANEIQREPGGAGLAHVARALGPKLLGIVNGIDLERYDPMADPALAAPIDPSYPLQGKRDNKLALAGELGLTMPAAPLVGVVSRLTEQKGVDFVIENVDAIAPLGANLVVVGTGDPAFERELEWAALRLEGRMRFLRVFDERLARRVFAAADVLLVPSRFEPCGLTQLYALRYGALPIVTRVGGLRDTVVDIEADASRGTGFVLSEVSARALGDALTRAMETLHQPDVWRVLVRRVMRADHGWDASAREVVRRAYTSTDSAR